MWDVKNAVNGAMRSAITAGATGGLYCPNCFDVLAGKSDVDLIWVPVKFSDYALHEAAS